ncbi:propionate catabolism operon regulatory protein PrpR [Pseudorhodoferax sp. Leaf267]|uniref:propionate catabolism operon regulatory protein PrpR n=1 Tax=Pseudorhodoferax sp. Leaf267 TaxID=1736316 RepID=UPI0006FBB965|nr:propionate catabolism operon regulatory protein PrpR [Pseudorhodoferax sp. Leaf267]KQP11799.1 propionate catabolism operon regulatory protein PrpR [Pseudorhodoferax sp. Leaf267]
MSAIAFAATSRLPRLCFLGYRHLREFSAPVIAEYRSRAEIELLDSRVSETVALASERVDQGGVDAFISAGANAGLLRQQLRAPVATIQLAGLDILQALIAARRMSRRVGVVVYGKTLPDLEAVKDLLRIEIAQHAYETPDDAHRAIEALRTAGFTIIVGSSIVVEMAEAAGLCGLLAYSHASIRQGFEDAIELARVARMEAERHAQLGAVLYTLEDAVLAVDREHRVIAVNPPMQQILGAPAAGLLGRELSALQSELSLRETLATGASEGARVQHIGRRNWVAKRAPVRVRGEVVGAALTLYDAGSIHEADSRLRMQQRRQQASARYRFDDLEGQSPALLRAVASARRFARTDLTILIAGESGTGKELFAQSMHNESARAGKPFVAVNCAAFPESLLESELFGYEEGAFTGARRGGKRGLFEAAHTGTLFLDEIGDMPISLQTRMLRVLQEREVLRVGSSSPVPVDLRVIAATHQPLAEMVAQGRFRQDLYFRLNILRLALPPLRERAGDVARMAEQRVQRCLARLQSPLPAGPALQALLPRLQAYAWPGNVRELENICERLAVYLVQFAPGEPIDWSGLPHDCPELFADGVPRASTALPVAVAGPRTGLARETLRQHAGNRQSAARALGISRSTLWRWLQQEPG